MSHPALDAFLALGASAVGAAVGIVTPLFVAASAPEVAPWAQTGGIATAIGGLAYVAKLLADGKLVAQPVHELIVKADSREKDLLDLLADAKEREDALRSLLLAKGVGR